MYPSIRGFGSSRLRNKLFQELGFPDEALLDLTKSDFSRINSMRDKVNARAQL